MQSKFSDSQSKVPQVAMSQPYNSMSESGLKIKDNVI